ncbi:MAG TPA: hypothetical protein PK131_00180 [Candidatus Woesebacteria bacterium]|nr:hypothetical protein [Candidatus Woesebacteria bacterium]HRT39769.1 hypothetical protein [Candidatus Woesebacteria bacterium]
MKLQSLKPSRIKNRVNLVFDDGSYLPFLVDEALKLGLKTGQEVNFMELKEKSTNYLAREYALRQIALSPKTEKLLRRKLLHKFPNFLPDQLIQELKPYLEETQYINYILKRFKDRSNREISYRLKLAGINYQSQENDLAKIKALLKKKPKTTFASLIRKGFAYDDVKSTFDKLTSIE